MYLDTDKKIDFCVPLTLQEVIREIDDAYAQGDDFQFTLLRDDVESITKQCMINGSITASQLNTIFERYGLR